MPHEFPFAWFLAAFAAYTVLLFVISNLTTRSLKSNSFFSGDHNAPWPIVAYGMVGASISGVTFISVPGNVWTQNFFYMPLVLGFVVGYVVIAKVLLPLYYKMQVTSIYTYLGERFGDITHKTGSIVFMVSRILGAAVRIFVVVVVLYTFIPKGSMSDTLVFSIVTAIFLTLVYLYTYKGGVKTIIWTDVLQTTLMLLAVFFTIYFVGKDMDWKIGGMKSYMGWFDWNWGDGTNAVKQFVAGIFMTVAMTGLDQGMMQKNLACKDIKSAQKNMYTTSIIIVVVNLFFLFLGALLCVYVQSKGGMDALGITKTDQIFPVVASRYLGVGVGILFLIGLISAAYPSAGAALTSLTTSFCIDFVGFNKRTDLHRNRKEKIRKWVQAFFTVLFFVIILLLFLYSNDAVINLVYKFASYTYGPLLGMFFFGILTKVKVKDGATPWIAVASPLLCLVFNLIAKRYFGFDLGFSLLVVNGALSFLGMWLFRVRPGKGAVAPETVKSNLLNADKTVE
ncbi:MAG: sodium:solute symporter [Bacteroidales bacterium]|jgi:Na+/proline symporter|nr:sodium:solute symporter [Bacteroidales bacterium]MCI2121224.1 sodium:solute symporter [Bacteroidales bacterium]MCI2145986.1 sodium:solute symporter [Bacteroidales bacterium]